jgi:hypothetical protein
MFGVPLGPKTARKLWRTIRIVLGFCAGFMLLVQVVYYRLHLGAFSRMRLTLGEWLLLLVTVYALLACLRARWNPFRL